MQVNTLAAAARRTGARTASLCASICAGALLIAPVAPGADQNSDASPPPPAASPPAAPCPQPFTARFTVEWHGFRVGTSTLELSRRGPGEFTYQSRNTARGIFRLALPDTITQTSHFSIEDGRVIPHTYVGDDGSSDTSRDVSLKFDWQAREVTGVAEDRPVRQPLEPGVQDSLSVQIALMCALAEGRSPESFLLIDKDEVKEYQYRHERDERLKTAVGSFDTLVYTSQREGSSRLTRLWIAPELGYLPLRAEQVKGDRREVRLQITSLERG